MADEARHRAQEESDMETVIEDRLVTLRTDIVSPTGAEQWLLRDTKTGQHYIASGVRVPFSGWEVLVFYADSGGEVTDWMEVAGGRGLTYAEAIDELRGRLP